MNGRAVASDDPFRMVDFAIADQFNVETTRALSNESVMTQVVAKRLAQMLGAVVNEPLARPRPALKSLDS